MTDGARGGVTLCELDAWRAALAWREHLERRVRLEVDLSECDDDAARVAPSRFAVVDTFEWVTFVFNGFHHEGFRAVGDINEVLAPARAATIVWYALTCCPGFSGAENPNFWRGVFTELAQPAFGRSSNNTRRAQLPITEAVRFFDDPNKPFPRIRLVPKGRDAERCLRGFLHAGKNGAQPRGDPHSHELERILTALKPYIRASRWSRGIPIAMDEVSAKTIAAFLPRMHVRCTPSPEGPLAPPDFRLESIFLQGKDLASLDMLQQLVVFSHAKMVVRRCDSADVRALISAPEETRNMLRRRVHVSTVDLIRPKESASHFAAMCAAIPSSEWITAARVFSFGVPNPKDRLYQSNIAWLGYAIFHPDAANSEASSLTDLEISSYRFPFELLRILRTMSTGNNLLPMMSGTKPAIAKAYFSGRIDPGTVGRAKPNRFSHSVYTFTEHQWVTICATTANTSLMDSWVAAVVPGVGLAWIRKHSIRAVAKRAPAASCLRRLRLAFGDDPQAALFALLGIIGKELEYLDIADCTFNSIPMESILSYCPRLKSLRISYSQEFWSDEANAGLAVNFPQLEELELHITSERPSRVTMETLCSPILTSLKTLRIVVAVANVFFLSRHSFIATLETFPSIQYAHWHARNGSMLHQTAAPEEIVSYNIRQHRSLERLGDLQGYSGNVLDGPTKLRGRCAFLSVVHHEALREDHSVHSAVGSFGPDILRNIFSFTPATNPREVYISDGEEL